MVELFLLRKNNYIFDIRGFGAEFGGRYMENIGFGPKMFSDSYEENPNTFFVEYLKEKGMSVAWSHRQVIPTYDGMISSVMKYDKPQPRLNEEAWKFACGFIDYHFNPHIAYTSVSTYETVKDDLDMSTSPGYPWTLQYHDKRKFFESPIGDYVCDLFYEGIKTTCWEPVWTVSIKRELRTIEKVNAGKVRTFTAAPIEHVVALNRLCLDFNRQYYDCNGITWSYVGLNPFQGNWNRLYHYLNHFSEGAALDVKEFDSSMFVRNFEAMLQYRISRMRTKDRTPENINRLYSLYQMAIHSLMIIPHMSGRGRLVRKSTGNPSGCANTIVDNTFFLIRLFVYVWFVVFRGTEFCNYEVMGRHLRVAMYGDDNTFTVSRDVFRVFNPKVIRDVLGELGVVITSDTFEFSPIRELDFLSHKFIESEIQGFWLPLANKNRVLSSLMWGGKNVSPLAQLARAYSLRATSWACNETRKILQEFIEWIYLKHRDELTSYTQNDEVITRMQIEQSYKSDYDLRAAFTGFESNCSINGLSSCKIFTDPFKILSSSYLFNTYSDFDLLL